MRRILISLILLMQGNLSEAQEVLPLNAVQLAKKHSINYPKPAADFFEGALLGNGAMGAVITTRPDAIVIRFGHNNVWDIRIAEKNREALGTFKSVFAKVDQIPANLANLTDDDWYNKYNKMSAENYAKPYPRPFPCGSLLLGFDRRKIQLIGHELDISNGLCRVELLTADKKRLFLSIFTAMSDDRLWMELVDENGKPHANLFNRIKIIPDPSTPQEFPTYQSVENLDGGTMEFRQVLPHQESGQVTSNQSPSKDKAFSLSVSTNQKLSKKQRMSWNGNPENMGLLEAAMDESQPFLACVSLKEGSDIQLAAATAASQAISHAQLKTVFDRNVLSWNAYWNKSAVQLGDEFLEKIWYTNLYFFNCATRPEAACPGLFANWSYNQIGTAWHGDYHMNYNTQQPFWLCFSSNHLEKNLAYVNLVESLMPVSRKWAKEYYELPGAYFPHSAYPVEMSMNPYPIPDWGWEVSETPWAVQGLWWQYLYSGDEDFLRKRGYEPVKAAVEFLVAYMQRPESHGDKRWKDNKYHIFPSVPPELYGLRPGFKYNYDGAVDLSLTKFIFKAFKQAVKVLGTTARDKKLVAAIDEILSAFPAYPTANSEKYGKVLVSVPEEHDQVVYNVPGALFTVFPGEDYGLHSDKKTLEMLTSTYLNQQNEGGNDLVFMNLQAARIGQLDLEQFKRQINYCLLPNGTATDMVMQTGGRYGDQTDFAYMSKMGIWFENFALPAVINECLLQGYNGTLSVFPNWPKDKDAAFNNLRCAGAFLISAAQQKGKVLEIKVLSEKGQDLHIILPWDHSYVITGEGKKEINGSDFRIKTRPGEILRFNSSAVR